MVDILPSNIYHQLPTIMPLENWTFEKLKANVLDILNISHRFTSQETIRHGKGPGLLNIEQPTGCNEGCGETCECNTEIDLSDKWGYDIDTYEEVTLLQQISAGRTAYDEEWNVITEHTIQALFGKPKGKGKML